MYNEWKRIDYQGWHMFTRRRERERPRMRWRDCIERNMRKAELEDVDWRMVAQDTGQWRRVVHRAAERCSHPYPWNQGNMKRERNTDEINWVDTCIAKALASVIEKAWMCNRSLIVINESKVTSQVSCPNFKLRDTNKSTWFSKYTNGISHYLFDPWKACTGGRIAWVDISGKRAGKRVFMLYRYSIFVSERSFPVMWLTFSNAIRETLYLTLNRTFVMLLTLTSRRATIPARPSWTLLADAPKFWRAGPCLQRLL